MQKCDTCRTQCTEHGTPRCRFHENCIEQYSKCKICGIAYTPTIEWGYDHGSDSLLCFDCWPKMQCITCPETTVDPFAEGWSEHDDVWACNECSATCHLCNISMPLGCTIVTKAWVYDILAGYECNKHV